MARRTAATGKSDTKFYQITCHPPRRGSFIYDLSVNLLGNAIWEMAKYTFGDFIRDSLSALLRNVTFEEPPVPRIEPYFSAVDKRNSQLTDRRLVFQRDSTQTARSFPLQHGRRR